MIAIIKYNAGNIKSVEIAIKRLGYDSIVTDDTEQIKAADKVIFPGVGEASSAMRYLKERKLDQLILSLTQPFLGICLGLQLMCNHSEEGNTECLGIFDTKVKRFPPKELVPHMGWNNLEVVKPNFLADASQLEDVFFVHSYFAEICPETTMGCNYILPFSAAMQKDNFYAVQFHPEKSARMGDRILKSFLSL